MRNKAKRILNVGCGVDTYGTDFIDLNPRRKNVIRCDVGRDRFPYPSNTFDEVYSRQMVMYVSNLAHFINECRRVLKPGGRIWISSAAAAYYGFINNQFEDRDKYKAYNLQTTATLKNLLEIGGFRNIKVHSGYVRPRIRSARIRLGGYGQRLLGSISRRLRPDVIGSAEK
ncbi:MAG: methyltransferase domain-containing protein [Candidatus Micrarchaeota archaeon]|nr:methyltransferase domain-containing protein [Candidatus Micrarchaeota archaeon]